MGGTVNLRGPGGIVKSYDDADDAGIATALHEGYRVETPAEQATRSSRAGAIEGYGIDTIAGKAKLAISEALGGLSFGASTALEARNPVRRAEINLGREENPGLATVSNIFGAAVPAVLSAGVGTAGALARATPTGFAAGLATRALESGLAKGVVGKTIVGAGVGAAEGAVAGAGNYLAQTALENKDASAEGFFGAVLHGGFWGGAAGGAGGLTIGAAERARKLFPRSEVTEAAATAAERKAATEISGTLRDTDELEKLGRQTVNDYRHARVATDPEAALHAESVRAAKLAEAQAKAQGAQELAGSRTARRQIDELRLERAKAGKGGARKPRAVVEEPPPAVAPTVRESLTVDPAVTARQAAVRQRAAGGAVAPSPVAAAGDDLESLLAQSVKRTQAGEPIGALTAESRAARAPSVDQHVDDAIAELHPPTAQIRDAVNELAEAKAALQPHFSADASLEALLGQSVSRLKAGESIGDLSAATRPAGAGKTWNPMLNRHIVGGGSASDLEQAAFRGRPVATGEDVLAHAAPKADPTETVTKALRGKLDDPDDLAVIIPKIQRIEQAEANMVDALGPAMAPPGSARRATEFRAAQAAHVEAQSMATATSAQAVSDAGGLEVARAMAAVTPGAAPAATAGGRGVASNAADAASILEVLSSLNVPGLPSARDIPVIGPLLSLYLKARAATSVWRRLGGKIPASVETGVALRAAATRDRIAKAVDGLVSAGIRGAKTTATAAPLAAEILSRRLFADERDGKHKGTPEPMHIMWTKRADELQRAMAPGAMAASLRDRVRTADPMLAQALVAGAERRASYLSERMPRPPPGATVGDGEFPWRPPTSEIEKFAELVHALDDPAGVLERAIVGDVDINQATAIRDVYPSLYAEAQGRLLSAVVDGADIPYRRRIQLGFLFSMPLDSTQEPSFLARQQAGLAPAPAPQPAQPMTPQPSPGIVGTPNFAANMQLQEMR